MKEFGNDYMTICPSSHSKRVMDTGQLKSWSNLLDVLTMGKH